MLSFTPSKQTAAHFCGLIQQEKRVLCIQTDFVYLRGFYYVLKLGPLDRVEFGSSIYNGFFFFAFSTHHQCVLVRIFLPQPRAHLRQKLFVDSGVLGDWKMDQGPCRGRGSGRPVVPTKSYVMNELRILSFWGCYFWITFSPLSFRKVFLWGS